MWLAYKVTDKPKSYTFQNRVVITITIIAGTGKCYIRFTNAFHI